MRRITPVVPLVALLALVPAIARGQSPLAQSPLAQSPLAQSPVAAAARVAPATRNVTVDYHMARARDHRYARRWDAALAALDSVLAADPRAAGAHPMRALVLAERGDTAGTLAAIRAAHRAGDTLASATALQIGNDRYRLATSSRQESDLVAAFATLQLADSIAPSEPRRGVARLLMAATALSLANQQLPTGGAPASCANVATATTRLAVARSSVAGALGAPTQQRVQVWSAVEQLAAYAGIEARRLGCA